jgi:hypothetical protein
MRPRSPASDPAPVVRSAPPAPRQPRPDPRGARWWLLAGGVLLGAWAAWWGASLARPVPCLWPGPSLSDHDRLSYILIWPFVGIDFQHNYAAVNSWLDGHDPYLAIENDPMNGNYIYPPPTLLAFAWVGLFPPASVPTLLSIAGPHGVTEFPYCRPAVFLWMAGIVLIVAVAAWQSWGVRRRLGLPPLPFVFVLGATLLSYPVMFELERGNCDVLPLLALALLVLPALAWRHRLAGDLGVAAGVVLAVDIKAYPGILLLGLIACRRYRAAALGAGLLAVQVAAFWQPFREWFAIIRSDEGRSTTLFMDYSHSLLVHWQLAWATVGAPALGRLPREMVVDLLVLAAVLAVSWRVHRARPDPAVAWPYLLWLTTMGTMVNSTAYDYSLLYLPLAVLAAWDHRDPWRVQLCLLPALVWWLPFYIGLTGLPLLLLKVAGVFLVGGLVVRRLQPAPAAPPLPLTTSPAPAV